MACSHSGRLVIFSMPIRFGQTNEDVASIIKQNDKTRRQPTVRQIIRDEAAPAPLVLQLVEYVFPSIKSAAVEPIMRAQWEEKPAAGGQSERSGSGAPRRQHGLRRRPAHPEPRLARDATAGGRHARRRRPPAPADIRHGRHRRDQDRQPPHPRVHILAAGQLAFARRIAHQFSLIVAVALPAAPPALNANCRCG